MPKYIHEKTKKTSNIIKIIYISIKYMVSKLT